MLACMYIFGALTRSWEKVVSIEKCLRLRGWILSLHVQAGSAAHTASYSPHIVDPSSGFKDESWSESSPRSSSGYK
jgi:hypothetical protein